MIKPLIIQSDNTMLLEVANPLYEEVRDSIAPFAELEKSPEHIHTYRITSLSLWNAAASGLKQEEIVEILEAYSRYDIPDIVITTVKEQFSRYGLLKLIKEDDQLLLTSKDPLLLTEIFKNKQMEKFIVEKISPTILSIKPILRGHIKQSLIKLGFPVEDLAGYDDGEDLPIKLVETLPTGKPFDIRDYQQDAINAFHRGGGPEGGSGVLVLPCGAGKTIVGIGILALLQKQTLILVTNTVSLHQWKNEILEKTDIDPEMIGEFSGDKKEIKPITIATYNILTYRKNKNADFKYFDIFSSNNWGLILYDEVHLLPAPVFRMTAEIQAKRRAGLTATLVREDGLETDVFSLIGPKKFDIPWKVLEKTNWIAEALCTEIRIPLPEFQRFQYSVASDREKFRIASENEYKGDVIYKILEHHAGDKILIIGQYLNQLQEISHRFKLPLITGSTANKEREELYNDFRTGTIKVLVVSKIANFSIDLPDANVAIQISGTFGSRQEEAQRLGRVLRPKSDNNKAFFYTIITAQSVEEKFAHNRQLFLTEQGYSYQILNKEMFDEQFN